MWRGGVLYLTASGCMLIWEEGGEDDRSDRWWVILDVTVVIDGKSQNVIWGENVELKTIQHPDPPTGCTGLKFDFPLDKVDGEMQVCFSLVRPYAVGPVNLCLFGGGQTASGLTICGPSCGSTESCESTFYQKETVCVPVTVSRLHIPEPPEQSAAAILSSTLIHSVRAAKPPARLL